jgi:hypothetical protein
MPSLVMALVSLIIFCCSLQSKLIEPLSKKPIIGVFGDSTLRFSSRFRIESFYGKNIQLLNSFNPTDQVVIPVRHTIDGNLLYEYGYEKYGYDIVTLQITARNKGVWGSPESIASTDRSVVKLDEVVFGEHAHFLNRHYLWIREFWMQASLNEMFNLNFYNNHFFTAGFFPFELGHAIALGDAYSTDPDVLGFYSPNAVDQYAPGIKLSGTLDYDEVLAYDLYVAILTNRSDTFNNVNRKILGQEYGHECQQERGFGKINWLAAGRFQLTMNCDDNGKIVFEPYFLFNDQREQEIEFLGDSATKLATLGFSIEAEMGCIEMGFEFAHNLGRQDVKGWDRNVIKAATREGAFDAINSQVTVASVTPPSPDTAGEKALYRPENQQYVNDAVRSQAQNGQIITPESANPQLRNSARRFRDPYVNTLSGYMAVWDVTCKCCPGLKISAAAGLATGDRNPNKDLNRMGDSAIDSDYRGFIGLQEQYSGNRVRSAFLMSGAGRIPRVVSFPADDLPDPYPDKNSRFTNLMYVGVGLCAESGTWSINPNILSYWQEQPTRFFPRRIDGQPNIPPTSMPLTTRCFLSMPPRAQLASPWLGMEFNLFVDACLDNSMKFFAVASVFVPGTHYADIKGRGLTRDQEKFLDAFDRTGIVSGEHVPVLGTDAALSINVGLEYRF